MQDPPAKRARISFPVAEGSFSFINGPSDRPFQGNDGVLEFNYWVNHGCILPSDIAQLIQSTLDSSILSVTPYLSSGALDDVKNINIFALHGVNSHLLSESLAFMPFLSSCTSMPIRYTTDATATPTFNDPSSSSKQWRYSDVEPMNSMIMWPATKSILPLSQISHLTPIELFATHTLLFRGYHNNWTDSLLFASDPQHTEAYNSRVQKLSQEIPHCSPEAPGCIGRFQRQSTSDAGIFYLSRLEGEAQWCLVLAWDNWDPEIVFLFDEGIADLQFSSITNERSLRLMLDRVYPKGEGLHGLRVISSAAESSLTLAAQYEACRGDLHALCLSPDMMQLMGYSSQSDVLVYGEDEAGVEFVSTSSFKTSAQPRGVVVAMEEGEEDEECEVAEDSGAAEERLEVCAIDCEMCLTTEGNALTRVSVVCPLRGVVYDSLVKPDLPIVDYLTEYSGLTKDKLEHVTVTLRDVHVRLRALLSADTIIIGHSLDSDLRALQLHHARVIDTAALFPHPKGLPLKQSLKKLAETVLGKAIRVDDAIGHDSVEDALVALELVFVKANDSYTDQSILTPHYWTAPPRESLFKRIGKQAEAEAELHSCSVVSRLSAWEKYCKGYTPESDVCSSLEDCPDARFQGQRHSDCYTAFEAGVQSIAQPTVSRRLTWVDVPFDIRNGNMNVNYGAPAGWVSLESFDECLKEAYAAMSPSSLILVLTQGDMRDLRTMMAKRQQHRWDSSRFSWEYEDETELIQAAANCLAGAVFLRRKISTA